MTVLELMQELALGPMRRTETPAAANNFTTKWRRLTGGPEFSGALVVRAMGMKIAAIVTSHDRPALLEMTEAGRDWLAEQQRNAA